MSPLRQLDDKLQQFKNCMFEISIHITTISACKMDLKAIQCIAIWYGVNRSLTVTK